MGLSGSLSVHPDKHLQLGMDGLNLGGLSEGLSAAERRNPVGVPPATGRTNSTGQTVCVHHWLIGDPDQGKAEGVCRKCSARRTFDGGVPVDYRAWKEIPFVTGIVPLRYRQWGDREIEEEME